MGRLLSRSYPDGTQSAFAYNQLGQLTSAENTDCVVALEWDPNGRIVRELQDNVILDYTYNAMGGLSRIQVPGRSATFARDIRGRVTRVEDSVAGTYVVTYDGSDRMLELRGPNGLRTTFDYDAAGRLEEHRSEHAGRLVYSRRYAYDRVNRLREIVEEPRRRRTTIDYDMLDRVVSIDVNGRVMCRYAYDTRDNMTASPSVRVAEYGPGNRLTRQDDVRIESDALGRVVRRVKNGDVVEFTYGPEHELLSVVSPSSPPVRFRYDALLRRISKTVDAQETRYLWVGDQPWRVVEASRTLDHVTLGPNGRLLAQVVDGNAYDVITDHLGNPVALVDGNGEIAWQQIAPFVAEETSGVDCAWRFPGQLFDAETELAYNRFRYFDPATSRYMTPDPLPFMQGLNSFSYVDNDFLNQIDPLGLSCFDPECDRLFKEMDNYVNTADGQAPHPNNAPINGNANAHFRGMRERAEHLARNRGQQPLRRLPGDPLGQRQTILSHRRMYSEQQVALQRVVARWDAAGCQPKNTSDPTRAGAVQQQGREWAVREPPPIKHVGDPAQVFGKITIKTPFGVGY
jgi:RHS repeat-associated protein